MSEIKNWIDNFLSVIVRNYVGEDECNYFGNFSDNNGLRKNINIGIMKKYFYDNMCTHFDLYKNISNNIDTTKYSAFDFLFLNSHKYTKHINLTKYIHNRVESDEWYYATSNEILWFFQINYNAIKVRTFKHTPLRAYTKFKLTKCNHKLCTTCSASTFDTLNKFCVLHDNLICCDISGNINIFNIFGLLLGTINKLNNVAGLIENEPKNYYFASIYPCNDNHFCVVIKIHGDDFTVGFVAFNINDITQRSHIMLINHIEDDYGIYYNIFSYPICVYEMIKHVTNSPITKARYKVLNVKWTKCIYLYCPNIPQRFDLKKEGNNSNITLPWTLIDNNSAMMTIHAYKIKNTVNFYEYELLIVRPIYWHPDENTIKDGTFVEDNETRYAIVDGFTKIWTHNKYLQECIDDLFFELLSYFPK